MRWSARLEESPNRSVMSGPLALLSAVERVAA